MSAADKFIKFGNKEFIPEGWYWLLRSKKLKKGKALPAELMDKQLVVFRGESGKVHALDAHCPHMGAHLCDGKVEDNSIVCPFHRWKFSSDGDCTDIPIGGADPSRIKKIQRYKLKEAYGLIWLWTGEVGAEVPIPEIPELKGFELSSSLGTSFTKECHPNVMMINAIDAHHFKSVHNLGVDLKFNTLALSKKCIQFSNTTALPQKNIFLKLISKLYKNALTYEMTYWWGNTGSVMIGPDFLHFYIMFALRPTFDGRAEGQTILITKKRKTFFFGMLLDSLILFVTKRVGNYFAKGDTLIFSKIKFNLKNPVRADKNIIDFIKHYETQPKSSIFVAKPSNDKRSEKASKPSIDFVSL